MIDVSFDVSCNPEGYWLTFWFGSHPDMFVYEASVLQEIARVMSWEMSLKSTFFTFFTLDIQALLSWLLINQICLSGNRLTLGLTKSFYIITSAHAGVWKRQSVLLHSTRSSPHIERSFVLMMSTNVSELCIKN